MSTFCHGRNGLNALLVTSTLAADDRGNLSKAIQNTVEEEEDIYLAQTMTTIAHNRTIILIGLLIHVAKAGHPNSPTKHIHRVSKKLCQLIFCSLSVKYEPISIKIVRIVPEETLNETVPN